MRTLVPLLLAVSFARAEIVTSKIEYRDGDAVLEGILVHDDEAEGKRPGVLVVHQWMGISEHERTMAKRLAGLGYVAFVADVYGKGVRAKSREEAGKLASKYRSGDGKLFRSRMHAALVTLQGQKTVDPEKVGAIGFCFGGTGVLELARSGAPVNGVVSFHGGLKTPQPAKEGAVEAKILVCHGADDPVVPDEEVVAFMKEMRKAKADWQLNAYGGAVHSFTQKSANSPGRSMYDEEAATRSWRAMKAFFEGCFG